MILQWPGALGLAAVVLFAVAPLSAASEAAETAGQADTNPNPTPTPNPSPSPPHNAREEDLFGAATPLPASPPATPTPFVARDMELGGRVSVRGHWALAERIAPQEARLSTPTVLTGWADARPKEDVRAFIQGRFIHFLDADSQDGQAAVDRGTLDQAWLAFDANNRVFFTVGRQAVKWGVGRIWSPVDFINPERRDPLAIVDERVGVGMLRAVLPVRHGSLTTIVEFEGASALHDVGGAMRAEARLGAAEASISGAWREERSLRLGADASGGVGPIEMKGEVAILHQVRSPSYVGSFDPTLFLLPQARDRRSEWIPQALGGVEIPFRYGASDVALVGVEYFYNGAGYDDARLYPWLLLVGEFTPFYVGRNYAGAYLAVPSPGPYEQLSLVLTGISNLGDESHVLRADLGWLFRNNLQLNVFAVGHGGRPGEFRLGIDIPPVTDFPGLEDGIEIPRPVFDAGVWLSLQI